MVLISARLLFLYSALFPVLPILLSLFFYYTRHFRGGRIRTISEMVVKNPERTIFSVTLTVTSFLILLCFIVREQWIRANTKLSSVYRHVVNVSIPIFSLCAILIGEVTLADSPPLHLIAATILFAGILLYLIASDFKIHRVSPIRRLSRSLPYIGVVLFVIYTVILFRFARNRTVYSVGSICEYLVAVVLFWKLALAGKDLPPRTYLSIGVAESHD